MLNAFTQAVLAVGTLYVPAFLCVIRLATSASSCYLPISPRRLGFNAIYPINQVFPDQVKFRENIKQGYQHKKDFL